MLERLRTQFGTAGLVVAVVALVAAVGGTALAASGALTGKQKREVTKIAKKYAGKPGAAGAQGPVGLAGAKGDVGAAGAAGKDGTNGTNGTNGVSPTGTIFIGEKGGCAEGGVEFKGANNTTFACNGAPWTAGGTLPPGETETGTWTLNANDAFSLVDLTFNIPLAEAPEEIRFVNKDGEEFQEFGEPVVYTPPTRCMGTVPQPTAPPGIVCVYADKQAALNPGTGDFGFLSPHPDERRYMSGAIFAFAKATGGAAFGTWAVTAPTS